MPRKIKTGVRRRRRPQKGEGPVWDWIKKAAKDVHKFVKDNKLISRGAQTLAPYAGQYAGTVTNVGRAAGELGYGRTHRRRRRR